MNKNQFLGRVLHGLAGAGPMLFFLVASAEGSQRSDYDWVAQPISALALGPRGWVQELNFALLAVSFLAFAAVSRAVFQRGPVSLVAPLLFVVMSVGVVIAGIFPMDAPFAEPTLAGKLHDLGGFLVFPSIPVVVLLLSRRFRDDLGFRPYFKYTFLTGALCLTLLVFFLLFVGPPTAPPRAASEYRGLVQRTLLLPFFTWIAVVVRRAYQVANGASEPLHVHV
jgi:hypothetical protein